MLVYSINIFYCNFYIHVCNGVGPQVLTTLVTAKSVPKMRTYLHVCEYRPVAVRVPGKDPLSAFRQCIYIKSNY